MLSVDFLPVTARVQFGDKLMNLRNRMYVYIIRHLFLKYSLIFRRVLEVFDVPLDESHLDRRVKYQPVFQKKVSNNVFIASLRKMLPLG